MLVKRKGCCAVLALPLQVKHIGDIIAIRNPLPYYQVILTIYVRIPNSLGQLLIRSADQMGFQEIDLPPLSNDNNPNFDPERAI
jgi:hypothetical protein